MSLEHKHTLASIVNAYNKREEDDLAFEICIIRGQKYFNLLDIYGDTILHTAVRESADPAIVRKLLEYHADGNILSTFDGLTPLATAFSRGKNDLCGVFLEAEDMREYTHAGVSESHSKSSTYPYTEFPEEVALDYSYPLLVNVRNEGPAAFEEYLLNYKNLFNIFDIYGDTILHTVVRESTDLDLVKGLLRHGADVNLSSKFDGLTPVSIAIRKGSKEVAYLLATPKVRATDVELEAYTGAAETYTGEAMAGAAAEVSAPGSHAARVVRNSRSDGMITAEGVVAAGEGSHAARLTDEELAKTGGLKL